MVALMLQRGLDHAAEERGRRRWSARGTARRFNGASTTRPRNETVGASGSGGIAYLLQRGLDHAAEERQLREIRSHHLIEPLRFNGASTTRPRNAVTAPSDSR